MPTASGKAIMPTTAEVRCRYTHQVTGSPGALVRTHPTMSTHTTHRMISGAMLRGSTGQIRAAATNSATLASATVLMQTVKTHPPGPRPYVLTETAGGNATPCIHCIAQPDARQAVLRTSAPTSSDTMRACLTCHPRPLD